MRIKIKSKTPKLGERRNKIKFAWLPVRAKKTEGCGEEYLVWLEWYVQKQEYMDEMLPTGEWKVVGWKNKGNLN